jgi:hypothetical protein
VVAEDMWLVVAEDMWWVGEIEIKAKLSPAGAGTWAELGKKKKEKRKEDYINKNKKQTKKLKN